MREATTRGLICLDDENGFVHHLSKVEYTVRDDESFQYSFEPNYPVIDLLSPPTFQGIPGLDLSLRKKRYMRENQVPVFISERTPARNREDLWELLGEHNMDYLNQLEWLIRTDTRYAGDRLYVRRIELTGDLPELDIDTVVASSQNTEQAMRSLLQALCRGNKLSHIGLALGNKERKAIYNLLQTLYEKGKNYRESLRVEAVKKSASQGNYKGRRPAPIDDTLLDEVVTGYRAGSLSSDKACAKLGVSKATFFRRMKKWETRSLSK